MTINIEYESNTSLDLDYKAIIESVVLKALELETCPYEVEINIILTNNEDIKSINKKHRGIDSPTDVLSYPMIDYDIPGDFSVLEGNFNEYFNPETGELLLGDIVISVDKIIGQADEYGHSQERELAFLIAHSILHLFGYDHMEESTIMEEKQEDILQGLQIGR